MKKICMIAITFFVAQGWQSLKAVAVSVVVPKQCLVEKASLVLYMLDGFGQQSVGTCRLNEAFATRNILPQDLQIQAQETVDQLHNTIDVTHASQPCDHEIVLHIEFNTDIRVIRVLVVKDSLLADDPFDVLSISVADMSEVEEIDEFDQLSNLVDDIDPIKVNTNSSHSNNSLLTQYSLYAKIYVMMQYKYAQRKMKDFTAWWYKKR